MTPTNRPPPLLSSLDCSPARPAPERRTAILLLGPTGSGKTPLGNCLEECGLWGHRCLHFDFGENLRQAVAGNAISSAFTREDVEFLRGVLASGALLEDEQFPIAQRILAGFLAQRDADRAAWVVLNGLPRHLGQARALELTLDVAVVVELACDAPTVAARIGSNVGGDRSQRVDDDLAAVARKLELFAQRTTPLREHYRIQGARVETIAVRSDTTAAAIWSQLEARR